MNSPALELEELVALYLCGALPSREHTQFEIRLNAGWPEAEAELRRQQESVRALAEVEPIEPPAELLANLLPKLPPQSDSRSQDRQAAAKMPGVRFHFGEDGEFRPLPYPGIAMRVLHIDADRKQFTCLLKMAAGATLPEHPHDGPEECFVISGQITLGGVTMRAGDYQRAEPNSQHVEHHAEKESVLYLTIPLSLLR